MNTHLVRRPMVRRLKLSKSFFFITTANTDNECLFCFRTHALFFLIFLSFRKFHFSPQIKLLHFYSSSIVALLDEQKGRRTRSKKFSKMLPIKQRTEFIESAQNKHPARRRRVALAVCLFTTWKNCTCIPGLWPNVFITSLFLYVTLGAQTTFLYINRNEYYTIQLGLRRIETR